MYNAFFETLEGALGVRSWTVFAVELTNIADRPPDLGLCTAGGRHYIAVAMYSVASLCDYMFHTFRFQPDFLIITRVVRVSCDCIGHYCARAVGLFSGTVVLAVDKSFADGTVEYTY